jgi:hypothetical protein
MDAKQILSLRPKLTEYLEQFADCFKRSDTRGHLPVYVEGQLSDLRELRADCRRAGHAAADLTVPQLAGVGVGS